VRTISFSHDGRLLASASEDLIIDIGDTETGEKIADIAVDAATFTVAWHPKQYLLAYACDDKEQNDRRKDAGNLKVFGFAE
jgi:THO complex subunit 3